MGKTYNKTDWLNDNAPALNQTNLNNIEDGIATNNRLDLSTTHNMSSDADYTLSAIQNDYGRIYITDTGVVLSTGRSIILNNNEHTLLLTNLTLQSLTIKTSAGAGILVGPGHTGQLRNNTTDIVNTDEYAQTTAEVKINGQDWTGVSYTDPDAVGANPTAKIYPDGTVVGSTDNGAYTKYPNGKAAYRTVDFTGIAVNSATNGGFRSNGVLYTAPVTLITVDSREALCDVNSSIWGSSDTSSFRLLSFESSTGRVGYIVVSGRWK